MLNPRACIFFFLLLTGCDFSVSGKNTWQPKILDPVSGQIREITTSETAGKTLVINYWAEWCKPCIKEIPELNQFAAQNRDQVIVLGINFDQLEIAALRTAASRARIDYFLLITDPAEVLALPEISGLPTTFILDSEGKVKKTLVGPQTLTSLQAALL